MARFNPFSQIRPVKLPEIKSFLGFGKQQPQVQQPQLRQQETVTPQIAQGQLPATPTPIPFLPPPLPAPVLAQPRPVAPQQVQQPIPQRFNAFGVPVAEPQQQTVSPGLLRLQEQAEGIQRGLGELQPTAPIDVGREERRRGLEEEVLRGLRTLPEEETAQQRLNKLIASRELGLQAVGEKPIALPFITGQQAAIERRAAVQTIPLTQQLGLLQGRRQAALEEATTRLGFEEARQEREEERAQPDETKISEFTNPQGERIVVFRDNKTGKIRQESLGAIEREGVEGFTLGPGQVRFDEAGNIIATGGPRMPTEAEITKALERTEKDATARTTQVNTIGTITEILSDPNLSRISGSFIGRKLYGAGFTGTAGVRGQVEQLKALTSLEGREKLKGSGTISDFEANMLLESANALNSAILDDGQIAMPDTDVARNLRNIRGSLLLKAGQSVTAVITNPETGESIQTELTSKEAQDLFLDGNLIDFQ